MTAQRRTLTVPPSPHSPLMQPHGAAVVAAPPASGPRATQATPEELAEIAERARHTAWVRRARAERARLAASPCSPLTRESLAVLDYLLEQDEEAWAARVRRVGGGGP